MAGIVDLRFLGEDMDDSSFCQQKPYPCTAEYYTFTSLFDNVRGVKYVGAYSKYMYVLVHGKYGPTSTTCFLFCTQGTVCMVHYK